MTEKTCKHTPGPWRGIARHGMGWVVSDSDKGITVGGATGNDAERYYGGNLIAESVSPCNVPLIAAAPDLLEACKDVLIGWPDSFSLEKVSAAVAKAEAP